MTKTKTNKNYKLDPTVTVTEVDLDDEPITLKDGTVLDEAAAEQYGREIADRAAAKRRGRPSLGKPGARSPQVAVRVPIDLKMKVERIAVRDDLKPSDILRRALEEYVERHDLEGHDLERQDGAEGDIRTSFTHTTKEGEQVTVNIVAKKPKGS